MIEATPVSAPTSVRVYSSFASMSTLRLTLRARSIISRRVLSRSRLSAAIIAMRPEILNTLSLDCWSSVPVASKAPLKCASTL